LLRRAPGAERGSGQNQTDPNQPQTASDVLTRKKGAPF
jgi:hypothetical protein